PSPCSALPSSHDQTALSLLPSFPTRRSSDLPAVTSQSRARSRATRSPDVAPIPSKLNQPATNTWGLISCPAWRGRSSRRALGSRDRKSTRLNSSHSQISYAVFCLKKKRLLRL